LYLGATKAEIFLLENDKKKYVEKKAFKDLSREFNTFILHYIYMRLSESR